MTTEPTQRKPGPKRRQTGPEYDNFMRLDGASTDTSLTGRLMGSLKPGAFLAIAVAIVLIYLDSFAGVRLPRALSSVAVLAAFFGPALLALLARIRAARRPPDGSKGPDSPGP